MSISGEVTGEVGSERGRVPREGVHYLDEAGREDALLSPRLAPAISEPFLYPSVSLKWFDLVSISKLQLSKENPIQ